MSSGHLLEASTATRLDASQDAKALPSAAFDVAPKIVYPSLYPLPGSSHPPLVYAPNATLPTSPPLASGTYSPGVAYYAADYQGYNTIYSPEGFMPCMENQALPMNNTNLSVTHYPFHDIPVGNAISTTAPSVSEDTGRYGQCAQLTSNSPLPTQPEVALDQRQVQHLQYHWSAVQEDPSVAGPPLQPGNVHIEYYQTDQEPHAAPVAPGVGLCTDQSNNKVHPPEQTATAHPCSKNPNTVCSGRVLFCIDLLDVFMAKWPGLLSKEKVADYAVDYTAPSGSNGGQSAGQSSQVDTTDPPPTQHGQMGWGIPWPGSNTTVSPSTSGYSSPSGSFVHPPSRSASASSSSGSTSRPAAKRQRSEEECTDAQGGLSHDGDPCAGNNQISDCSENPRKKKKSSDDGEYICRICLILGKFVALSRRDSLKRHVSKLHEIFCVLFGHEHFDILKPRQKNRDEDLKPWILMCISLQLEAARRGMEIRPEQDLAVLYPDISATLNQS